MGVGAFKPGPANLDEIIGFGPIEHSPIIHRFVRTCPISELLMLAIEPLAVHPRPVVMALGALYSRSLRRFQPEIRRLWHARWRGIQIGNRNMVAIETPTVRCLKPACFS